MNQPSQPLLSALRRGWRWWRRELADLVPRNSDAGRARRAAGLIVSPDASGLRVIDQRTRRGKSRTLTGEEARDAISAASRRRPPVPVWLRLPHAACFVRTVELPEAVRDEAGNFLELDLERATPFRIKDVYSSYFASAAKPSEGMTSYSHVIVRRETVDRLLAELEVAGIKASGADCWNAGETDALPINFLEAKSGTGSAARPGAAARKWLTAAALALMVSAGYLTLVRHEAALASLSLQTDAARAQAQAKRQSLSDTEEKQRALESVVRYRAQSAARVQILEDLTRLLPDSAWVSNMRIDGDTVEISGEAQSAAPLLAVLEDSAQFKDAAFTAPVTRDEAASKERFSLRMKLTSAPVTSTPADEDPAP